MWRDGKYGVVKIHRHVQAEGFSLERDGAQQVLDLGLDHARKLASL